MNVIARLATEKKGKLQLQIDILEKTNDSDVGNPVEIHEFINSRKMPVVKGYLNLRKANNDDSLMWFTLHSLAREVDSRGHYITKPKTNSDGLYIDKSGSATENLDDADTDYELAKVNNRNFYVNKATVYLNNKNQKTGKEYKQTIVNLKYFSEQEAKHIKSVSDLLKVEQDENVKTDLMNKIKQMKSDYGTYITMFINKGNDFFKANGFEIREQKTKNFYKKKDFGDNIPF